MSTQKIVWVAAAAAIVWTFSVGPMAAQQYPFCRKTEAGAGDCRYDTLEQCQAAISGTAGFCQPNYFLPPAGQNAPRRRGRHS